MGESFEALAAQSGVLPTRVLGDQVVDELRMWIIKGQLEPGTHLVEARLSAAFGVSRGPIRDALVQLEAEGLVKSRRGGTFVRGLEQKDVDELYAIREAIELLALTTAEGLDEPDWSMSEAPLHEMKTAADAGDHVTFARADLEFHGTFYDVAGNHRLATIWSQYAPTFAVLIELTTAEDIDLGPSYDSHAEILDRMRNHKLDAAKLTLQEHLLGSRTRLTAAFAHLTAGERRPEEPDATGSTPSDGGTPE